VPSRLARLTANTITTPVALRKELERVRADGVAYDREEQTEGICAVAAVLKGVTEQMVAVSVPVPAQRFYRRESELAQALLAWVQKVDACFESATRERNRAASSGGAEQAGPHGAWAAADVSGRLR